MPRYEYYCTVCEQDTTVQHLSDEIADACPGCLKTGTLKKKLSTFSTPRSSTTRRQRVGETTEEFIRTARDELKQQKDDLGDKR